MFKILNDEQLPILQIVPLIFIWGIAFCITKIALLLDFATEQSVQWEGMSTFQSHNAQLCQARCSTETETMHYTANKV